MSKSPRLVLVNTDKQHFNMPTEIRSATPEINKKRINIEEPTFKVRPTKSSLMLREKNNKSALNISGDLQSFRRGLSPQKSTRDLGKKWQNDELQALVQRQPDLTSILDSNEWAKLLRPKLKTANQTIDCVEEIFTARHSYEKRFTGGGKNNVDNNDLIPFINELQDVKYPNKKLKTQNIVDVLHSINYHRSKTTEIALFDSFLTEEYECLILIFFLLLRSKTEITLNIRF